MPPWLHSFILKFKNLLLSGKNATLLIKSNSGNAEVSLSVELGEIPPPPDQQHCHRSRNGPSRQRRRLRRAAEKAASNAEEAKEAVEEAEEASDEEMNTDG